MKKNIFIPLLSVFIFIFFQSACMGNDGQAASGENSGGSKENIKVTFIELGSVRCIPCKKMEPVMQEIRNEYKDQVKVVFYDVWTEEGAPFAKTYKIRLIPTQVFLDSEGKEYFRHEGFFPKEELIGILRMKGVN